MTFEVRQTVPGMVSIPTEVDHKYRHFLIARAPGPMKGRIRSCLQNGPSRGGAEEAMRYYGPALQDVLFSTVNLVERLEGECKGIWKWFQVSGFGNDKDFIGVVSDWAALEAPKSRFASELH